MGLIRYLLLFVAWPLAAQDVPQMITKNFQFTDGIYFSHAAFRANQPDLSWEVVQANLFTNPQTYLTQIEYIRQDTGREEISIPLDSIWMVCLGGIPYLRLPPGAIQKDLATFAGLQLRGKICYLNYPKLVTKKIPISAYSPVTGKPFRTGWVEREDWEEVEMILHFETGELRPLTIDNFLAWIQDDEPLVRTVEALTTEEIQEKLFKCLLIYDDRNAVFTSGQR